MPFSLSIIAAMLDLQNLREPNSHPLGRTFYPSQPSSALSYVNSLVFLFPLRVECFLFSSLDLRWTLRKILQGPVKTGTACGHYHCGVLPWRESAPVTADLDPPRIWTPRSRSASGFGPGGPNPLADMDPLSRIWTPLKSSVLLSKIGKIVFWSC